MSEDLGQAWDRVACYFDSERKTTSQVYPSEWFFLKDCLRPGLRVLDVGCAQGGFANVLAEHLEDFTYTGLDVSAEMIGRARESHPGHEFHLVDGPQWPPLNGRQFDLVLVLGILHLHHEWRHTIEQAWSHTAGTLLLDLREYPGPTIEDTRISSFRMDFGGQDDGTVLPYVLVNSAEALGLLQRIGADSASLSHYGYLHAVSGSARTVVDKVMTNVWRLKR